MRTRVPYFYSNMFACVQFYVFATPRWQQFYIERPLILESREATNDIYRNSRCTSCSDYDFVRLNYAWNVCATDDLRIVRKAGENLCVVVVCTFAFIFNYLLRFMVATIVSYGIHDCLKSKIKIEREHTQRNVHSQLNNMRATKNRATSLRYSIHFTHGGTPHMEPWTESVRATKSTSHKNNTMLTRDHTLQHKTAAANVRIDWINREWRARTRCVQPFWHNVARTFNAILNHKTYT